MKNLVLVLFSLLMLASCTVSKNMLKQHTWVDIVVTNEEEIYLDTSAIERKDATYCYAWVKTIYTTENSRSKYVQKIRDSYKNITDDELNKKMKKWNGFSYNISYRVYDCLNKRYRTTIVSDYSADGKLIITAEPNKKVEKWIKVETDAVVDHVLYFVCDYGN